MFEDTGGSACDPSLSRSSLSSSTPLCSVPRASHSPRPEDFPSSYRRHDRLHRPSLPPPPSALTPCAVRPRLIPLRPEQGTHSARARRMQRFRRLRLRHLYLPTVPHLRDRGSRQVRSARRSWRRHLLPQGGSRAGRGDQVPRVQRAQEGGR